MSYSQAIFLAVIQALTEFLPVSSSGHLVIFQKLFRLQEPPVLFDILVHLGTLGAVVIFLRRRLAQVVNGLARMEKESWRAVQIILIGTMPAVVVGLFLQGQIGMIFDSLPLVAICLLITAGLLFSSAKVGETKKKLKDLKWPDALWIGVFQALAILPGVSRSGSTIVAGLWRSLERKEAFLFSFYLAIPAMVGASLLQLPHLVSGRFEYLNQALVGMAVSGVIGYFALLVLQKVLLQKRLWLLGIYCLSLGLALFLTS